MKLRPLLKVVPEQSKDWGSFAGSWLKNHLEHLVLLLLMESSLGSVDDVHIFTQKATKKGALTPLRLF